MRESETTKKPQNEQYLFGRESKTTKKLKMNNISLGGSRKLQKASKLLLNIIKHSTALHTATNDAKQQFSISSHESKVVLMFLYMYKFMHNQINQVEHLLNLDRFRMKFFY